MKHIEYYVAEDGTRFDDEYECKIYEEVKQMGDIDTSKHLKVFDSDKNPIKIGNFNEEYYDSIAKYI
jgi:hypothetical protein